MMSRNETIVVNITALEKQTQKLWLFDGKTIDLAAILIHCIHFNVAFF